MVESLVHSPEERLELGKRRTPLPVGQLSILMFLRFCESASTFVIFPFLSELLASVTGGDDAKVGYYAGLMESIRQSLSLVSVMYWSRLSDQIGRKPVLLLGTLALAISTTSFGLSRTFWVLVVSRCIFTAFNSNAGVIKSMVGEITDHSNSADAFALLHVPWAVGSSFGALTGGWLARPHDHFPHTFHNDFWITYPYFLPCAVMASLAMFACWIIVVYLKETVESGPFYKKSAADVDSDLQPLLASSSNLASTSTCNAGERDTSEDPVPLQSLLHLKVLIPVLNYVCIAALHAASNAIQPLFLAMPVAIGGLGLPPRNVGYILGVYGITNSIFQTFMLGRLVRRFGVKNIFVTAISAFVPIFTFSPLMNVFVGAEGFSYVVWIMLGCQLSCSLMMELGYGASFNSFALIR
ncbi:major facilitator superfamily domain-containing protein [Flammula alnicola]|nr:major facilitator superfamily domain-containing protein [Flammula alnicola]